mmetsp:Transcript_12803/g.39343  ORF Transcript_12803/g.39343 Transcript_12803/m.39343 type:complete len:255 (-) Transcript_12803:963-1727(-)
MGAARLDGQLEELLRRPGVLRNILGTVQQHACHVELRLNNAKVCSPPLKLEVLDVVLPGHVVHAVVEVRNPRVHVLRPEIYLVWIVEHRSCGKLVEVCSGVAVLLYVDAKHVFVRECGERIRTSRFCCKVQVEQFPGLIPGKFRWYEARVQKHRRHGLCLRIAHAICTFKQLRAFLQILFYIRASSAQVHQCQSCNGAAVSSAAGLAQNSHGLLVFACIDLGGSVQHHQLQFIHDLVTLNLRSVILFLVDGNGT